MRSNWNLVVAAAALFAAAPLSAQDVQQPSAAATVQAVPQQTAAGSVREAPVPVTTTAAEARFAPYSATKLGAMERLNGTSVTSAGTEGTVMTMRRSATRHSTALMIVGGAGILLGAVVGGQAGTIIMIGSGAVGLYGLYQYMQ